MQIPSRDRERQYELTYLISGTFTSEEVTKVKAQVQDLLKKHKFSIVREEDWGRKMLAYAIRYAGKQQREANYFHVVFEGDTSKVDSLEQSVRLNQQIMRHLLVVADKPTGDQKAAVVPEPAVEKPAAEVEKEAAEVKSEEKAQ